MSMLVYHGQITHGLLQVSICYSHGITSLSYELLVVGECSTLTASLFCSLAIIVMHRWTLFGKRGTITF